MVFVSGKKIQTLDFDIWLKSYRNSIMKKRPINILCCLLILNFLSGCVSVPEYKYESTVVSRQLLNNETVTSRVSAAVEAWRNSGVSVEAGKSYLINAKGKWRTYPSCNFTGPDGIGLYNGLCVKTPLFPALLQSYSHSTLVAKVGEKGKVFAVGAEYKLTAADRGELFFRINDTTNTNYDNEGYVDVSIKALTSVQSKPADPMQNLILASIPPTELTQQTLPALDVIKTIARPRTALVIGNSDYIQSPLKNPVNDAKAMAASLKQLGFQVDLQLNAGQEQMETAIDSFGRRLTSGAQVALFYYAGHGVQVDGENYLIPIDAKIARQSDVRYKAVNIGQILGAMSEAKDNLNIVILDACRDNPLPRSFRSASRGLARLEGPKGTIIGFATSPGSVAADGEGDNGVYTKHLLANMSRPGISIEQVFKKVLQGVNKETKGKQTPWTESSFTGDFSFLPN